MCDVHDAQGSPSLLFQGGTPAKLPPPGTNSQQEQQWKQMQQAKQQQAREQSLQLQEQRSHGKGCRFFFFFFNEMTLVVPHSVSAMGQLLPPPPPPTSTISSSSTTATTTSQLEARLSQPPLQAPPEGTRDQLRYLLQRDKDQPAQQQQSVQTTARVWVPGASETLGVGRAAFSAHSLAHKPLALHNATVVELTLGCIAVSSLSRT